MPGEEKKTFLKNDRILVCSMLAFYGLCILGLIGATFWGLDKRNKKISLESTSTANSFATLQSYATTTAVARLAEQDDYEYVERFDIPTSRWYTGQYDREYGDATLSIKEGVYVWKIDDPKSYIQSTDFDSDSALLDFDVYMDLKFVKSSALGSTCSGLVFRKSPVGWQGGAYIFSICNDSHYEVQYYGSDHWNAIAISEYESVIHRTDWNRIGVSARKNHFVFTINNQNIFEMTDDRRKGGGLGIYVDLDEKNSAVLWFDNFGLQSR